MLVGQAPLDRLAAGAPTIPAWVTGAVTLSGVTCVQLVAELRRASRDALLPPSLHATDPPALSLQVWQVADSPWGAFRWAHSRLSCRSGVRARGFTTAAVATTDDAVAGLSATFGFPCRRGEVGLAVHYDDVECSVDGALALVGLDPLLLGPDDVQYTGTMNLAHTPSGLRLVQVEAHHRTRRVQRLRGRIDRFDAAAWGDDRLDPYWVVAMTVADEDAVELPAPRFVCRADVTAFEGTERVA
jgi:hypothetical protein